MAHISSIIIKIGNNGQPTVILLSKDELLIKSIQEIDFKAESFFYF